MARGKRRERWTEDHAAELLESWRASGVPLTEFCRQRGVGYARLRRWQGKLAGTRPRFASVEMVPRATTSREVCIDLPSGVRITVSGLCEPEAVAGLVRALEGSAC